MRMQVQSLALLNGLRVQHCHELWCRSQTWLLLVLLWLWYRLAATALTQPLAWELPYAAGVALKVKKKKTTTKIQKNKKNPKGFHIKMLEHLRSKEASQPFR